MPLQITSTDNPRVKAVVRLLREHRQRKQTGLFVAEGSRQIVRALAAGLRLQELYHCPALPSPPTAETQALPALLKNTPAIAVSEHVLRKMAYRENPEAHLAVFTQPQWALADLPLPPAPLFLIAMGISKPGNLGAMVRTAQAAGATAVLVADAAVDPFNPNAIHASTGAVFTLPTLGADAATLIAYLTARHVPIYGAVVDARHPYTAVDLRGPAALAIGAEDRGLDETWVRAAQQHGRCITIPMPGPAVDSLNASNAAAILLFEAVRQRSLPA